MVMVYSWAGISSSVGGPGTDAQRQAANSGASPAAVRIVDSVDSVERVACSRECPTPPAGARSTLRARRHLVGCTGLVMIEADRSNPSAVSIQSLRSREPAPSTPRRSLVASFAAEKIDAGLREAPPG